MRRLRQGLLPVFFFVAFLLQCAQLCLATGHSHGTGPVAASPSRNPGHVPCHFPTAFPQGASDKCPDCGDHLFLGAVPAGLETQAASGPLLSPVCLPLQAPLAPFVQQHSKGFWFGQTTAPLSRYLLLSVLRL